MKLTKLDRELFLETGLKIATKKDGFYKTFIRKADMQNLWEKGQSYAYVENGEVCGAIILTCSKQYPTVVNLQLLHTFEKHRGRGIAKMLCEEGLKWAYENDFPYFRVSSEPGSVKFYEKIGFKMLGKQKSGCQLSMFKLNGLTFDEGIYDINDPIINKAVFKKGKGGCIEIFEL